MSKKTITRLKPTDVTNAYRAAEQVRQNFLIQQGWKLKQNATTGFWLFHKRMDRIPWRLKPEAAFVKEWANISKIEQGGEA